MPSRRVNDNRRASAVVNKNIRSHRPVAPDCNNQVAVSVERRKIYTRSDSPGARSYAAVLSDTSPPPPSQRRPAVASESRPATEVAEKHDIRSNNESTKSTIQRHQVVSPDSSDIEIIDAAVAVEPSTPKKTRKRSQKIRHAVISSGASEMDMSDSAGVYVSRHGAKKSRGKHTRVRLRDSYESDSFIELDGSDTAEIVKKAYHHAERAFSPAPADVIMGSPTGGSRVKAKLGEFEEVHRHKPVRPRIPSGIKSSPIRTRASYGIYKRRLQADAATPSEEERAPVSEAFHDIFHKRAHGNPASSYRSKPAASSPPDASAQSSSPSLSPEKISDGKPVSISPLKLGDLEPSPEIPSPEDPKAKRRRHQLFEKVRENASRRSRRYETSRGRTLERGTWRRHRSSSLQELSSSEDEPIPRTPKRKTGRRKNEETRVERNRAISPDWDLITHDEKYGVSRKKGKGTADDNSDSPSPRSKGNKGKQRATSPCSIRSTITPPSFQPSREDIEREVHNLLEAARASRLLHEAELRRAASDHNAGPSNTATPNSGEIEINAGPSNAAATPNSGEIEIKSSSANDDVTNGATANEHSVNNGGCSENVPKVNAVATVADSPTNTDTSYFRDYMSANSFCVQSLPAVCEVTNSSLWDPALASDYPALPKLRLGVLISWKNINAVGIVEYSGWLEQTPSINTELLSRAVRFTKYKHFGNPSRDTPLDYFVYDTFGKGLADRGVLYAKLPRDPNESEEPEEPGKPDESGKIPNQVNASDKGDTSKDPVKPVVSQEESQDKVSKLPEPKNVEPKDQDSKEKESNPLSQPPRSRMAICLTTIVVAESQVTAPSSTGIKNKYIKGPLHTQEMERMAGFLAMCFNQNVLGAQFDGDHNLSFGTMGQNNAKSGDGNSSKPESSTPAPSAQTFVHIRSKGLLRAVRQSTHHQYSRTHTRTVLNATDTVPVYNAVGQNFNLPEDIERFDQLPRHVGEVPLGSCALVGYTVSLYRNAKGPSLATNLQFVIILAIE